MGGGRCIFRNCTVSSVRNPGMHFFRFPVADSKRYDKWIKMAGAETILSLPIEQQKSKLICGRHFRDEHFMNYKKDRIVRGKAIPTLMRISKTEAYDFEQLDANKKPKLVTLENPERSHLIPPDGFKCPLGFDDDAMETSFDNQLEDTLEEQPETKISTNQQLKRRNSDEILRKELPKVPRILNTICFRDNSILETTEFIELNSEELNEGESFLLPESESVNINSITTYESDQSSERFIEIIAPKSISTADESEETVVKSEYDKMIESYEEQLATERNNSANKISQLEKETSKLKESKVKTQIQFAILTGQHKTAQTEIVKVTCKNEELQIAIDEISAKNNELNKFKTNWETLNKQHQKLQFEYKELQGQFENLRAAQQQVNTVSTSTAANIPAIATQSLTKVQLFNGIKKYLSASMIALLRMQMFGSAERQWKPDERQASVDLLGLGERVYRYFTDEWRFYLPSLSDTRNWTNSILNADIEEDL